jgi:Thioredoxin
MAKIVIPNEREPNNFPVPQLRVYDKQGRRVLERLGYYAPTFSAFLTRALTGGTPADPSRLLAHELDLVLAPDGMAISTLPDADYTIVDYWASWCLPCRAQDQELVKVLTANSSVRVNLLKVEADTSQKTPQEIMQMLQAGRESVAARKKPQG